MSCSKDFGAGSIAGLLAGVVVAPFESIKVDFQLPCPLSGKKLSNADKWKLLKTRSTYERAVMNIPGFSLFFAAVCGLEFSVNDRVARWGRETYNTPFLGIPASAATGGVLLASADHLMAVRKMYPKEDFWTSAQRVVGRRMATGFSPMFCREATFITSVMYAGPATGAALQRHKVFGDREDRFYNAAGRMIAGAPLMLLSQPFDCLAREMQFEFKRTGLPPRLLLCCETLLRDRAFFKGAAPRIVLATIGGTLATDIFDTCRKSRMFAE